jgi:nitroreductase
LSPLGHRDRMAVARALVVLPRARRRYTAGVLAHWRRAQLAAGLAEGRMHLAAYALGAGATGMTFLDSEIPALIPGGGPDALIFTCVGVPANASTAAGPPASPR